MCIRSEKHQNATLDRLVQFKNEFAKVFVALVKIFIVEVKLELIALVVAADNSRKNLAFSYKVLANKLNAEVRIEIVFQNLHWGKSATC